MLHTPQQRKQYHHPTSIHPRPRPAHPVQSHNAHPHAGGAARRGAAAIVAATAALMTVGVASATAANPVPCSPHRRRQAQLRVLRRGRRQVRRLAGSGRRHDRRLPAQGHQLGALPAGRRPRQQRRVLQQQLGLDASPTTTSAVGSTPSTPRAATTTARFSGGVPGCNNAHGAPPGGPAAPPPRAASAPPAGGKFPKDVTSAPDKARYDDAASWSGGKNCTGGFTVGAKRLQDWIKANFGAAEDPGLQLPAEHGRPLEDEHPRRRSRERLVPQRQQRGAGRTGRQLHQADVRPRRRDGACDGRAVLDLEPQAVQRQGPLRLASARYTGPNPHTDHVHIEQNLAGSKLQTSYWKLAR